MISVKRFDSVRLIAFELNYYLSFWFCSVFIEANVYVFLHTFTTWRAMASHWNHIPYFYLGATILRIHFELVKESKRLLRSICVLIFVLHLKYTWPYFHPLLPFFIMYEPRSTNRHCYSSKKRSRNRHWFSYFSCSFFLHKCISV